MMKEVLKEMKTEDDRLYAIYVKELNAFKIVE